MRNLYSVLIFSLLAILFLSLVHSQDMGLCKSNVNSCGLNTIDFNLSTLSNPKGIPMYLFYTPYCQFCKNVRDYLLELSKDYNLNVKAINKNRTKEESDFFHTILQSFNSNDFGVPVLVINNHIYHGSIEITDNLKSELDSYKNNKYGFYNPYNKKIKINHLIFTGLIIVGSTNPFITLLFLFSNIF